MEIIIRAWSNGQMLYQSTKDSFIVYNIERLFKKINGSDILMLSTGLRDLNGKLVYNGDLLRDPIESDWDKVNYSCFEVFWHDGDQCENYNMGFSMCRMHNHGAVCGGYIPGFKPKNVSKMVVCGNIYETPELLKK